MWTAGGGRWKLCGRRWKVDAGRRTEVMDGGSWKVEGRWWMTDGRWRTVGSERWMVDGGWRTMHGRWRRWTTAALLAADGTRPSRFRPLSCAARKASQRTLAGKEICGKPTYISSFIVYSLHRQQSMKKISVDKAHDNRRQIGCAKRHIRNTSMYCYPNFRKVAVDYRCC